MMSIFNGGIGHGPGLFRISYAGFPYSEVSYEHYDHLMCFCRPGL